MKRRISEGTSGSVREHDVRFISGDGSKGPKQSHHVTSSA